MDSPDITPIPIPSEDNAWQDMRDQLDKEMPLTDPAPAAVRRNSSPGKMLWTLSTVLLLTLAILLLRKAPTQSLVSGRKSVGSDAAAPLAVEKSVAAPSTVKKSVAAAPSPVNKSTAAKPYSSPHTRAQPLLSGRRTSTSEEHDARPSSVRVLTTHERDVVDRSSFPRQRDTAAQASSLPPIQENKTVPAPLSSLHQLDNTRAELPHEAETDSGAKRLTSTIHLNLPDTLYLTFGLQWTEQFPPFDYLFRGIQGHSSFVRALLPSAWMQLQLDKSILGIELNPFYSQNVSKVLETGYNSVNIGDTIAGTYTSRSLDKVFGLSANIHFLASIGGHWWAGGGLRTNWWTNAIGTDWTMVQLHTPAGFSSMTSSLKTAPISKSDWQYVPSFQLDLLGEILYKRGVSQAGFRLSVSPDAVQKDFNSDFFFEFEFFYRLDLFSKKLYLRER